MIHGSSNREYFYREPCGSLPIWRLLKNAFSPLFPWRRESVRPGAGATREGKVLFWVMLTPIAEGNCVAARRGREQPEAYKQPVG